MPLKSALVHKPAIYEIVPPRRDASRFNTELQGVEEVLRDSRIAAINIPELISRKENNGQTLYSPATIPPEEYAMLIKEYKESMVNIIAPRMERAAFLARARRILQEYRIPNVVVVGREKREDVLPGPGVLEAFRLLTPEKTDEVALGGICIFNRESSGVGYHGKEGSNLTEERRIWLKADAGCDFVTSQITFDPKPANRFLSSYQKMCEKTGKQPLTVFISLTTVPSESILSLLGDLDVVIPNQVRRRLAGGSSMGRESIRVGVEVFQEIVAEAERAGNEVPLGLQVEQVGVNSANLSMSLFDEVYPILKGG